MPLLLAALTLPPRVAWSLLALTLLGYTVVGLWHSAPAPHSTLHALSRELSPTHGLGMAVMALLMLARHHLLWWPLHPIGYVVSGTWILNSVWFSIFLAWLIKVLVLKYAGPGGYRGTRWFFLGMILGQFVVGGMWLVVDGFSGMTGNRIRMY